MPTIRWRVHLAATPEAVYELLATDAGRARFWAESAVEQDGRISFAFPGDETWTGEILEAARPHRFAVRYFGGSRASFELTRDGGGGTDLELTDDDVPDADVTETLAGWVSVLLALKASVDFGVDLRNHDPDRSWSRGYCDN